MSLPGTTADVHIKIRDVSGKKNPERSRAFNFVMVTLDGDWPYATGEFSQNKYWKMRECKCCGGRVWRNPKFEPRELKLLARQMGCNIKIERFALQSKCWKSGIAEYKDDYTVRQYPTTVAP